MDTLWSEIEKLCLERAKNLLNGETAPTTSRVEAVRGLVEAAFTASKAADRSPLGE